MSQTSNQDKINVYNILSPAARDKEYEDHTNRVLAWISGSDYHTCEEALCLVEAVPPVKLGGESCKTKEMSKTELEFALPLRRVMSVPDWMDDLVANVDFSAVPVSNIQRKRMLAVLSIDRAKPRGPDKVEKTVDDFHKSVILDPAAAIAGIVMGKVVEVAYAEQTDGSSTDLRVCDEDGALPNYIVAEDKRGRVWVNHEHGVLDLLAKRDFPSYNVEGASKPGAAIRICVQVYVQMHKFGTFYGKIFSPRGVVYVRRGSSDDVLEFSRIYHNLDDDVRRTACLIIEANRNPKGHYGMSVPQAIRSISKIWPFRAISAWIHRQILQLLLRIQTSLGTPTVAVGRLEGHWTLYTALPRWPFLLDFPLIFSTPLAAGATGDVWLSQDKSHVIKLFMNRGAAEHEAHMLLKCQDRLGPAVATFRGLYSDERRFGVVMRYVGSQIDPFDHAPLEQRYQLLATLHKLHSCGIHHHDVRPANVMVDNSGFVTLIDFDRAEEVYGECKGCPDLEVISSLGLETSTSAADPEPEIIPYM
ncbi:hypothetical protein B0H16DRAFT_1900214 [Mycena metata]|uniref:Protein kinase domain-containing protein n=1 Tax=Mycena metata TaxID=1033252 RepID=A0AAD7H4J0_9AGAR|nr:hypothetical protein B0H16DRAFT_1900214 [Mycena metata]